MNSAFNKSILFIFLIIHSFSSKAQYVIISDTAFQHFLIDNYPSAMLGNQMDTTNLNIVNATNIVCDSLFIRSIEGIQYFDNLQYLECRDNLIGSISKLPPNLIRFNCKTNQLDSLPTLPSSLLELYCNNNNLFELPILPSLIQHIDCSVNKLDSLPALSNFIQTLDCSSNNLSALPTLPNSLSVLVCNFNHLLSLPVLPNSLLKLNCVGNLITNIPLLPASINELNSSFNPLFSLPVLPNSLVYLDCTSDSISVLPTLPLSLQYLSCGQNLMSELPNLPVTLLLLDCSFSLLDTLPTLPATITNLNCSSNQIPFLPLLPTSLRKLNYSSNPIAILPSLPPNLEKLIWNSNTTPILPTLPSSLKILECSFSSIDSLPLLPSGLIELTCQYDSLNFLPVLPGTLTLLDFSNNIFTLMPSLPNSLTKLYFANNMITNVPVLPLSVRVLDCSGNINLNCLPKFNPHMYSVALSNTLISCLPNYFDITFQNKIYPGLSMPLCTPASGCPCSWNITGNIHTDTSANCLADSLNPGLRVNYVKMNLLKNATFLDDMMVTTQGEYSFDTGDDDTLIVSVNTLDMPFHVVCPVSGIHQVIVSPLDSLKTNVNFGVECNGIDPGVNVIIGRFRPGTISHIEIQAGSMSQFYNVVCPLSYSATVTTTIEGPVQYLMSSSGALVPSTVSGNTITYNVPDMSLIDPFTAFGIDVITDTSAVQGSEVCITTTVSNVLLDIVPSNNSRKICIPVVNSFDPNAKLVSPKSHSYPGDLLTYTIHFQNTGNDTAYKVVIRDTLSANLDVTSFKFLAASHNVEIDIQKNILIFYFHGINLLDSVNHEPQSHGWIQFTIKLNSNLVIGTKTFNQAAIYFDFNPPIITDTAINFIGLDPSMAIMENPIILPTAITPNWDGLNDNWQVLNKSYLLEKNLEIQQVFVMNRWGQKIFIGNGNNFIWQAPGIASAETFIYYIIYKTLSGNIRNQRGEITVVQ